MSCRNMKALVYWTKEEKTGIESLTNVPENSRFAGAATSVQFSGNKKWYPAKVIMISDDMQALEKRASDYDRNIEKQKLEQAGKKRKPAKKQNTALASEKQVALALGKRAPVLKELEPATKASRQALKDRKEAHKSGQNQLDQETLAVLQKKQSQSSTSMSLDSDNEYDSEAENSQQDGEENFDGGEEDASDDDKGHQSSCTCPASQLLQKYDNPTVLSFLGDLVNHFQSCKSASDSQTYLKLLPIPDSEKKVELTTGRGVFISASKKDELKVDYRNKPTTLVRETLYALFGPDAFRLNNVTGRGSKQGTCGIKEDVLRAVSSFVSRHMEGTMSVQKLVSTINKRSPDWRRVSPKRPANKSFSKEQCGKRMKHSPLNESEVKSTSPFKSSPLKAIQQMNSPGKGVSTSPFKCSPTDVPRPEGETVSKELFRSEGTPVQQSCQVAEESTAAPHPRYQAHHSTPPVNVGWDKTWGYHPSNNYYSDQWSGWGHPPASQEQVGPRHAYGPSTSGEHMSQSPIGTGGYPGSTFSGSHVPQGAPSFSGYSSAPGGHESAPSFSPPILGNHLLSL